MTLKPAASARSRKPRGSLRRNSTVNGPVATTSLTASKRPCLGLSTPAGGERMWWKLATTSSAVRGAPSWNFTPSRKEKVYVNPSSEIVHLSARSGITLSQCTGSICTSRSYMGACGPMFAMVPVWCKSYRVELASPPQRRTPPRLGFASGALSRPASGASEAAGGVAEVWAAADGQTMRSVTSRSPRLTESAQIRGRPCIELLLLGIDGADGCQDNHQQVRPGDACVNTHVMLAYRGEP